MFVWGCHHVQHVQHVRIKQIRIGFSMEGRKANTALIMTAVCGKISVHLIDYPHCLSDKGCAV